uniref:Uncharacterized protein n=1 Tax=Arundo donax TaxID=35708 RepID=A0A0A9DTS9_ARUDO
MLCIYQQIPMKFLIQRFSENLSKIKNKSTQQWYDQKLFNNDSTIFRWHIPGYCPCICFLIIGI